MFFQAIGQAVERNVWVHLFIHSANIPWVGTGPGLGLGLWRWPGPRGPLCSSFPRGIKPAAWSEWSGVLSASEGGRAERPAAGAPPCAPAGSRRLALPTALSPRRSERKILKNYSFYLCYGPVVSFCFRRIGNDETTDFKNRRFLKMITDDIYSECWRVGKWYMHLDIHL